MKIKDVENQRFSGCPRQSLGNFRDAKNPKYSLANPRSGDMRELAVACENTVACEESSHSCLARSATALLTIMGAHLYYFKDHKRVTFIMITYKGRSRIFIYFVTLCT